VPPRLKTRHLHGITPAGEHLNFEADTPGEHD
jgi:hypothetical protein